MQSSREDSESVLQCNSNSKHDNVDLFISELQTFLKLLNLQNRREMETDVQCKASSKCERLPRPVELQLSSIEASRLSSGTVYSPVTELSMNLGDLSTDTG